MEHARIVTIPKYLLPSRDHVLRRPCYDVPLHDAGALALCATIATEMYFVMLDAGGVAIAAPQIGFTWRIVVVGENDKVPYSPLVLLNPRSEELSDDRNTDVEGCLSLPGWRGAVERSNKITLSYYDLAGKKHVLNAEGYGARILQHELDHLEGMLYVDRTDDEQVRPGDPKRYLTARQAIAKLAETPKP